MRNYTLWLLGSFLAHSLSNDSAYACLSDHLHRGQSNEFASGSDMIRNEIISLRIC